MATVSDIVVKLILDTAELEAQMAKLKTALDATSTAITAITEWQAAMEKDSDDNGN
jgi:hypothetical protein